MAFISISSNNAFTGRPRWRHDRERRGTGQEFGFFMIKILRLVSGCS